MYSVLFVGPDDKDTCNTGGVDDAGCEGAVNGNPYPSIDEAPHPGTAGNCMSRCRHMLQIDGDAPDDVPTVDWSASIGFEEPVDEVVARDRTDYGGADEESIAADTARQNLVNQQTGEPLPDVSVDELAVAAMDNAADIAAYLTEEDLTLDDVSQLLTDEMRAAVAAQLGEVEGASLAELLDAGAVDALSSLLADETELAGAQELAAAGLDDSAQAFYLAEALSEATAEQWEVDFDGQRWYVTTRVEKALRAGKTVLKLTDG